ncbi:SulP family sulfate permease [Exophiala viscosa]|uniref:SulP family sulfate permease n=1 Tax=Exophiala viscosa TaxID=2486360 RepID=UPI00218FCBFC|nr:SulP family sulfate permease [Exophiala viscosa]
MADNSSSSSQGPSPPTSPRRPSFPNARNSSQHAPANPSRLRETTIMSPDERMARSKSNENYLPKSDENLLPPALDPGSTKPIVAEPESLLDNEGEDNTIQGQIEEPSTEEVNAKTRLLGDYHHNRICGMKDCNHGTFSPRAPSLSSDRDSLYNTPRSFGGEYPGATGEDGDPTYPARGILGDSVTDMFAGSKSLSTTQWLARKHGIKSRKWMYFSYYFPFVKWVRQYRWKWLQGDLVAALTMASFYIPMSLSYAANLGHIPPVNGLYSFVFNPLIYAFLGSSPQMVVGPEAAGSLLVGQVVRTCIDQGHSGDHDAVRNAQIAGVVTAIAGAVIFVAGLCRLGFLDSVLSRPFLRGFISAIGFVILVDQLIPELGLQAAAQEAGEIAHGSSAQKLVFLARNVRKSHGLTSAVSGASFVIIMLFRSLKRRLQPRYPSVAYFPDRFLVVVLSAVFAWAFAWNKQGVEILGDVKSTGRSAIPFHWRLQFSHMKHIDTALSTSFLIALLGFFESSVAAKSLGEGTHGLRGMVLSPNRELVALGAANMVGGCFMALPAFGGYGRSKVNASTGGTTPMSSILLSTITLICVLFLLPYFYYIPKGVLSAMISVVAYSLIEEAPHDIKFFLKIHGWTELFLMTAIFLATVFYSLSMGIALGIGLSLLQLIRHATKPRIQILGKVPGTANQFENAELTPEHIEYIEGCLIVKIPEPLTFANTGELKTRLRRLEQYGTNKAHPSLPRVRHEDNNRNIIFDVHGVTKIDGSGTQVLAELVEDYVKRGIRVIFCRLPRRRSKVFFAFERSGIVELCGGERHFVGSVEEALQLSEAEDLEQYFDARMNGHDSSRDTQW